MRKKVVVIIAAIIAFVFIFVIALPALVGLIEASAKTSQELQQELESLEERRKQRRIEMEKNKESQDSLLSEKRLLDDELDSLNSDIKIIQNEIDIKEGEIKQKEKEIENLNIEIDKGNDMLKKRLRVMYEKGSATYIEVLFEANNFSDLLTRIGLIQQIVEHDKRLIGQLTEQKDQVSRVKTQIETEQAEKEKMRTVLVGKQNDVEAKIKQSEKLINNLKTKVDLLKKADEEEAREGELIRAELKRIKSKTDPPSAPYTGGKLGWPSSIRGTITSEFGMRFDPIYKRNKMHTGIDIGVPMGTPVLAAADGVVVISGQHNAYGKYVVLDHGSISTLYAHNSELLVSVGQQVKRGQQIAKAGSTGNSTGPHIHFEVIDENGNYQNPRNYLF